VAYLIPKDYQSTIQDININQIISNDETIRDRSQLAGEAEAKSYLKQKYDTSLEFADMAPWAYATSYKAKQRFYLDAAAYSITSTYALHSLTLHSGGVYINTTAITVGEAWNAAKWTLIGNQYDIFYTNTPTLDFSYTAYYNINDTVFWKDKVYTCKVQTPLLDHDTALQYRAIQNIPLPNVAPDDPQSGLATWGTGASYSVPSGILPTDSTKFTKGDNRDAQMVLYLCDIVLFHLHSRIAPRNIPDLRVKRYDAAIDWLKTRTSSPLEASP
jgi:hypothetical protein